MAETQNNELVLSATKPKVQLPINKIRKNVRFETLRSKFKCQINQNVVRMTNLMNLGNETRACCKKPRQPISSNNPYTKMVITAMLGDVALEK